MSLLAMLKKGGLRQSATVTVATVATVTPVIAPSVAKVASVAVENPQTPAANDPAAPTMVQEVFSETVTKLIDIGTIRPPGLTPKLLAASLALDAQIAASDQFRNSHENVCADPDRWCWSHSTAMNGAEIDLFAARLHRFTDKGLTRIDSEALADRLVMRDRVADDRRLCLECTHLGGYGHTSWRCGNWQAAGVAMRQRDAQLPIDLVQLLQRCAGFTSSVTKPVGRSDEPP